MSFTRKIFLEGTTYHQEDWTELQDNIGNYYDALLAAMQIDIDLILGDYLTSAHRTEPDPHPDIDMDYIQQGDTYKKITAIEKGNYDLVYAAFGGSPSMDNIPDGIYFKKLTDTQELQLDTIWSAFGASPSMDNIPQGINYIKLSAAEYATFLSGFYDYTELPTSLVFGPNKTIANYLFANGADTDGGNIYANNIFSAGKPVYVLAYASPWHQINAGAALPATAHSLGYRPSFAQLQISLTDPDGQPEDYIYTDGYGGFSANHQLQNYAAWNNLYYRIYNNTQATYYFRILMFSYLGA